MQLRHLKTIHPPGELLDGRFQKVTAIAWSDHQTDRQSAGGMVAREREELA
jgi:hypothetical protein